MREDRILDGAVAEGDDPRLTELLSDLWVCSRVGTTDECTEAHRAIQDYVRSIRAKVRP
jgi:hypothetical protein